MITKSVLFSLCLWCSSLYAQTAVDLTWLTQYELTETQIETLTDWALEEKFPIDFLHKTALTFQKWNQRPTMYIPEHTPQDIIDVTNWAEGTAFLAYASRAGFLFDRAAYDRDCPNMALFNFGYATETVYLKTDVLQKALATTTAFIFAYAGSPDDFSRIYFERAEKAGFSQYLTPMLTASL